MQNSERETPEFERYASSYTELLDDPMRSRFARDPLHFHRRKWILIRSLLKRLGIASQTQRWVDVGCGQGELLSLAGSHFASAVGCDPSPGMLPPNASFQTCIQPSLVELPFEKASVDFVTAVCVYHHVHGAARMLLTEEIKRVLRPGGLCCIIEHNPRNPVTRAIVKRCPVDVDAELLTAPKTQLLFRASGFELVGTDYFLFFPESLFGSLGSLETMLSKVPLGGQYAMLARAPSEHSRS
jgi:SAM-dependent methyltransferase